VELSRPKHSAADAVVRAMAGVYASGFRFEWNPEAGAAAAVPHSVGPDGRDEHRAALADALRCAHQAPRVADEWVKDVTAKGFNGKQLLTEAKAACK
jgi:hypothetical protein